MHRNKNFVAENILNITVKRIEQGQRCELEQNFPVIQIISI